MPTNTIMLQVDMRRYLKRLIRVVRPRPKRTKIKDFSLFLHELRGRELTRMPRGAKVMLSAGCAGSWYFEWVAQNYGRPRKHIGIESYQPKPDDLPSEVDWIANTVGDMSGVMSSTVDLVFSGQNIEHLWPEDIEGFLTEANRVLRTGGSLVLDSPNRIVTSAQKWTHPEHIVEFTPAEIRELLELAGFDVLSIHGLWLCRDPNTGAALPFARLSGVPGWHRKERVRAARNDPDNSFVWWAVSRKKGEPDRQALKAAIDRICGRAWPERLTRLFSLASEGGPAAPQRVVSAAQGQSLPMIFGPYAPLRAGQYVATFAVQADAASLDADDVVATIDVMAGDDVLFERPVTARECLAGQPIEIAFQIDQLFFGMQFRLISTGRAALRAALLVGLRENDEILVPSPSL